ncbi:hypothetical protein [Achromobacter aegrifaciens]|uniref:Uncharacterized protein n=1 Tax=Achromobacter aegrifaciens TaxID=1287736 RepID=A0AAD2KLR5_ACHAE|nr:hypothetical protein [Achromobacter aegrifaciens]CUJ69293.1 Uncharacterised protein [Achromobacter aegrifaciens]
MSEWERIFGAGVSAEAVISGINASWSREEREAAKEAKQKRFLASMAYGGDESAKAALLKELKDASISDHLPVADRNVATLLRSPAGDFSTLVARYRIPEPLAALIDEIFVSIRQSEWTEQKGYLQALDWLIKCFDAIKPGVDLRFIVARFAASTAATGMACMRKKQDLACLRVAQPAFDILCARARGVLVPKTMVALAIRAIETALGGTLEDPYAFQPYSELGRHRGALATMAFALAEMPITAATIAAETDFSPRITGDISKYTFWHLHSQELLKLLEEAPSTRLAVINLDNTGETLDSLFHVAG